MRKITKLVMKQFNKEVVSILNKFGAKETDKEYYELNTIFGKLLIRIDSTPSELYTVFMRFETLDNQFYQFYDRRDINTHSYKWNLHSWDDDYVLTELEERLSNLEYANKVVRVADAIDEMIVDVMAWDESAIDEAFNELYKSAE